MRGIVAVVGIAAVGAAASVGCGGGTDEASPLDTTGSSGGSSGGTADAGGADAAKRTFTVGGAVTGLAGAGLVLQNNGSELAVSADGAFTFPAAVDGSTYAVTVKTQPSSPAQTCTVGNGTGKLAGANVTSVTVTCAATAYSVGATVTGLTGPSVVLTNGADEETRTTNGPFTFATHVATGAAYDIQVKTQPEGQHCAIQGGKGTVGDANVNATVTCGSYADCSAIKRADPAAGDGVYWLSPKGQAFQAYCDMTTDGGGWTMCYTERDATVHIKTETAYDAAKPFGTAGYRTDCRDIRFNSVLYVDHDSAKKAWFGRENGGLVAVEGGLGYAAAGNAAGLFYGFGEADVANGRRYQLNACDEVWMSTGLMMSGYTNCYKQCGSWCNDTQTQYFRTDGDDGGTYDGVAFAQNGHTNVTYKTMSVGVRAATSNLCATPTQGGTASISCPGGTKIKTIDFASFGTPTGSCGAFVQSASCNAGASKSIVEAACLGKEQCAVDAITGVFGDPCVGTTKRLYVQASCE